MTLYKHNVPDEAAAAAAAAGGFHPPPQRGDGARRPDSYRTSGHGGSTDGGTSRGSARDLRLRWPTAAGPTKQPYVVLSNWKAGVAEEACASNMFVSFLVQKIGVLFLE